MTLADAVRSRVLSAHADTLAAVADARDAVVASWDGDGASSRDAVVPPFRAELDERGLVGPLLALLTDAVEATGRSLPAPPVPAPPYLVVTSVGPVLRATLSDVRVVITIRAFDVERVGRADREPRTAETHYAPGPKTPAEMLEVETR